MTSKGITNEEARKPMLKTFGRIRTLAHQINNQRLIELVEKFNYDLQKADVREDYYTYVQGLAEVEDGFYRTEQREEII